MWWLIGIGGLFAILMYLGMLFLFGFMALGKGHGSIFVLGLFFPLVWVVGALMGPADGY